MSHRRMHTPRRGKAAWGRRRCGAAIMSGDIIAYSSGKCHWRQAAAETSKHFRNCIRRNRSDTTNKRGVPGIVSVGIGATLRTKKGIPGIASVEIREILRIERDISGIASVDKGRKLRMQRCVSGILSVDRGRKLRITSRIPDFAFVLMVNRKNLTFD